MSLTTLRLKPHPAHELTSAPHNTGSPPSMLSRYWISSDTPLGSLAKNKSLERLRLLCRGVVGETSFARVSLPNIRDVELSSFTTSPVLERLYLPSTANVSTQILPGGSFDPPLRAGSHVFRTYVSVYKPKINIFLHRTAPQILVSPSDGCLIHLHPYTILSQVRQA